LVVCSQRHRNPDAHLGIVWIGVEAGEQMQLGLTPQGIADIVANLKSL
jgi:hypothetical protein